MPVHIGALSACVAFIITGVTYTWWSLCRDRLRTLRRCPRCWYNLTGTAPSTRCPECGHDGRSERALYRVRRRWKHAILGALCVLVGLFGIATPAIRARDVTEIVPTSLLIRLLPLVRGADNWVARALVRRMATNELSHSEWRDLFRLMLRGDSDAQPISKTWQDKYGSIYEQWQARTPLLWIPGYNGSHPGRIEADLLRLLPVRITLVSTGVAASGDYRIFVTVHSLWPEPYTCLVRLLVGEQRWTVRPGGTELVVGRTVGSRSDSLVFEAQAVRVDTSDPTAEPSVVSKESIQVPLAQGRETELSPVVSASVDTMLRTGLQPKLILTDEKYMLVLERHITAVSELDAVSIGLDIDVMYEGDVVCSGAQAWLAGSDPLLGYGDSTVACDERQLGAIVESGGQLSAHIRGDSDIAARIAGASRYWSGDLVLPVGVLDMR